MIVTQLFFIFLKKHIHLHQFMHKGIPQMRQTCKEMREEFGARKVNSWKVSKFGYIWRNIKQRQNINTTISSCKNTSGCFNELMICYPVKSLEKWASHTSALSTLDSWIPVIFIFCSGDSKLDITKQQPSTICLPGTLWGKAFQLFLTFCFITLR